jgi:hypothetical protein
MNSEYVALMFKLGQARVNAQRVMKNIFENNDTPGCLTQRIRIKSNKYNGSISQIFK